MPVRKRRNYRYTKYEQVFKVIGVPFDNKATLIVKMLEKEGRTEGSICFAIWREKETLIEHRNNKEFWKVFGEAVNKWSWSKDDPRWQDYKKKKDAQRKAKELQEKRTFTKPVNDESPGFIYFIQGECGGPIKIGYTTDLLKRLKTLQTGYPDLLEVLLAFPGKPEYEKAIHKQFEEYRLNGEWFKSCPEVLARIKHFAVLNEYVTNGNKDLMQLSKLY